MNGGGAMTVNSTVAASTTGGVKEFNTLNDSVESVGHRVYAANGAIVVDGNRRTSARSI